MAARLGLIHINWQTAKANMILAVPALFYAINNYLKFIVQLFFKPVTAKMLGNLKVISIAIMLRIVMHRQFTVLQVAPKDLSCVGFGSEA